MAGFYLTKLKELAKEIGVNSLALLSDLKNWRKARVGGK